MKPNAGVKNFVGIQVGLISFLDEGVSEVLDILQESAHVNALLLSTLSWSRGNAGRATEFFPDHGKHEPDHLIGGSFVRIDPKYYAKTPIREFRSPDRIYQDVDFLELVLPEAKRRGIKVYPYYCETAGTNIKPTLVPNFIHLLEIDVWGRKAARPCLNNPDYRAWHLSIFEDYVAHYDIDGIVWGIERRGPIENLIAGDVPTCFCPHCLAEAHRRGIDTEQAKEGYRQLFAFFQNARAGHTFNDGAFVTCLRILFRYPAIMQWEKLWLDSHQSLYHEIYGAVKWLNPNLEVGLHIWQMINTFSLILRAQYDFDQFRRCADWLKPVLYHDAAGPRFHTIWGNLHQTILRDCDPRQTLPVMYRLLGLNEASYEDLPKTGFGADYIFRETIRTIRGVRNEVAVYPGLGVGVQGTGRENKQITPESVKEAVRASYRAGARGIVLCRNYSEAMLANLRAVGEALDELGIGETIPDNVCEVDYDFDGASRGQDRSTERMW